MSGGGGGIVHLSLVGASVTPEAYLEPFRTGGTGRFSDPGVDLLLDAACRAFPVAERDRLLAQAESTVLAAAAVVPVAQFRLLSVATPAVQDLDLAVDGTFDPVAVWLDR